MCEKCGGAFGVCDMRTCVGDRIMSGCGVEFRILPGDNETAFCLSCAEKRDAMDRGETFRVRWGRMGEHWSDFGSFDDARALWARTPGAELYNLDHADGTAGGLTEEQRASIGVE